MGQNRGATRAQSPKSNWSIGGGPWTPKKKGGHVGKKKIYSKGRVTTDCLTKSSNPDDCMGGPLLGTQNALHTWNDLAFAGNVSHWYPYG